MCDQAPFLNELIKANQRTKFHFFSIIIDLESPEIITTVVWLRLSKKTETSTQMYVFDIFVNISWTI